MIGTKVINNADETFTVTATDDGRVILAPDDFGSPLALCLAEFLADYRPVDGSTLPDTLPPTEAEAIAKADARANEGLNRRYARGVLGKGHGTAADQRGFRRPAGDRSPPAGSPEAVFAEIAAAADAKPKRKAKS